MTFEQFSAFERAEGERPLAARRRALSLAGAVLAVGGLALWVALAQVPPEVAPGLRELAQLGFVPLGVGGALLLHAAVSGGKRSG